MVSTGDIPGIENRFEDALRAGGFPDAILNDAPVEFSADGGRLLARPDVTDASLAVLEGSPPLARQDSDEDVDTFLASYAQALYEALDDDVAAGVDIASTKGELGAGGGAQTTQPVEAQAQDTDASPMPEGLVLRNGHYGQFEWGVEVELIHVGDNFGQRGCDPDTAPMVAWRGIDESEFDTLSEDRVVTAREAGQGRSSKWSIGAFDAIYGMMGKKGGGMGDSDSLLKEGWLVGIQDCLSGDILDGEWQAPWWKDPSEVTGPEMTVPYEGEDVIIYHIQKVKQAPPDAKSIKRAFQIDHDPLALYSPHGGMGMRTGLISDAPEGMKEPQWMQDDEDDTGGGGTATTTDDTTPTTTDSESTQSTRSAQEPSQSDRGGGETRPSSGGGDGGEPPGDSDDGRPTLGAADGFDADAFVEEFETEMGERMDEAIEASAEEAVDAATVTQDEIEYAIEQYPTDNWNDFFGQCRQDKFSASECGDLWSEVKERREQGDGGGGSDGGDVDTDTGNGGGSDADPSGGGGGGIVTIDEADTLDEVRYPHGQAFLMTMPNCPGCEITKAQPSVKEGLESGSLIEVHQDHPLWDDIMLTIETAETPTFAVYHEDRGFISQDEAEALDLM